MEGRQMSAHGSAITHDVVMAAMSRLVGVGLDRLAELLTRFTTGQTYDMPTFRRAIEENLPVGVVSLNTQTPYTVALLPSTLTDQSVHVVLVAIDGKVLDDDKMRKLTFSRDAQGNIEVLSGWR